MFACCRALDVIGCSRYDRRLVESRCSSRRFVVDNGIMPHNELAYISTRSRSMTWVKNGLAPSQEAAYL